ncbi:uncharacterized protein LOC124329028 [Daphnia pulicaria]|uniref:uncharacterized protein LOC124329028 n=1 Tax=Daphnia pulicaria TaxID=35523 RepID=UPI001EEA795F|nr:uncharacterized protein LOC124329028 [Daphnia pulicaria]XP_046643909.1 uncharacterized protein LOC124329028 [Daphnia pulicaria]
MNLGLKEEVKVVVNSLLVPHSRGLTLDKLLNEYANVEMKDFPYKQLGHNNPADFLASIPDVVKFTRLPSGHVLLQAISNSKTGHIQELVKGQKNSQTASFKNYNRITQYNNHYQPPARRYPNPTMQGNRNHFQPTQFSAPPGRMTHSYSNMAGNTNGKPTASQVVHINGNSLKAEIPPLRTCSSVEYESQLVSEFQNLFQFYPDGIDIAHVFALYSNKFKKEVYLQNIEPNLTSFAFFQRHGNVFRLWKRSDNTLVGLAGHETLRPSQLETAIPSPHADRGSLTGAVPKMHTPNNAAYSNGQSPTNRATPKFQSPTTAVPVQFTSPTNVAATPQSEDTMYRTTNGHIVQTQWAALDIRTRIPGTKPLQSMIVGGRDSDETLARIALQKVVPVPWHAPPRADEVLPDTFGVRKPKIKNVYEVNIPVGRQAFPGNLADFDYFFLIVAEVYSPGEFYWFLSENRKPIEDLTDDMTLFYSSNPEYVISRTEMYIGQLVAAMYTDNLWYRARIVGCHQDLFQVFYVDYGSKNFVKLDRIRHLHLHFLKMPLQAFRGRIFGIQPLQHEPKWSFESGKCFLDLIKGCKIIAAAKMIEETLEIPEYEIDTVYSLTLVDTTKENDIHVSDYLIENGFALHCEEEQIAVASANSVYEYSTPSPPAEHTGRAPSPNPICAFPSSAVNSVTSQLQTTSISITTPTLISNNEHLDFENPSIDELLFSERISSNIQPEEYVIASVKEPLPVLASERSLEANDSKCVDVLVLKDERRLYTVEDGGELYLPKPDILMLIPSLDSQIAAFKAKIDCKVVTAQTHPNIFADCAKAGAPWMKDDSLSELTLYSLQYVSLLFFLCSVKDKVASSAIEAKRKEFNNK